MTNTIIDGASTILVQTIFTILGLAMTYLIAKVSLYLDKKKKAEVAKEGVDAYNSHALVAKGIFYQVEQLFKLIPGAGALKATMFDKLLLAKFPVLTQSQLDHFRESIVGEVNSQVETLLAPAYDPITEKADVKVENIAEKEVEKEETVVADQVVAAQ
ncbi:hypothetical protein KTC96_24640 (plasmid) [Clostridium estertheticum]|uniref:hypothetical protein n=1 Tax=Clostridium estertheticum TaxID=238834 RepID=UPI001C7CB2CF|nr:hypothetical protein [Clostridium estertheticum]MBX4259716.1 hypothetical protein [Clostridium estertheticum]WLC73303.1 hypothetical protein KTC96_24640 [Clostridium estertheticum]